MDKSILSPTVTQMLQVAIQKSPKILYECYLLNHWISAVFGSSSNWFYQARLSENGEIEKNLLFFTESFSGCAYHKGGISSSNPKTSVHNVLGAGMCDVCVYTNSSQNRSRTSRQLNQLLCKLGVGTSHTIINGLCSWPLIEGPPWWWRWLILARKLSSITLPAANPH